MNGAFAYIQGVCSDERNISNRKLVWVVRDENGIKLIYDFMPVLTQNMIVRSYL